MKRTKNLNLFLPEDSDIIDVSQLSSNFEKLDEKIAFILTLLGYEGTVSYEVKNIDIGQPFANDVIIHSGNIYVAQIEASFQLTINGMRVLEKNIDTGINIYPFGINGAWEQKTGIPIVLCWKYDYKTKSNLLVGLWRYDMEGYQNPTVDGTVITFPLGEFEMDVWSKSGASNDIQYYEPTSYTTSGSITVNIEEGSDE